MFMDAFGYCRTVDWISFCLFCVLTLVWCPYCLKVWYMYYITCLHMFELYKSSGQNIWLVNCNKNGLWLSFIFKARFVLTPSAWPFIIINIILSFVHESQTTSIIWNIWSRFSRNSKTYTFHKKIKIIKNCFLVIHA